MLWIAPSEKDAASTSLEKRLWDAADQFRANSGLKAQEYSGYETPKFFTRDVSREKDETNKPIAVVGVHPDTLEVIVEFESISEAYKAGYQNVSTIIANKSDRQISHGLRWFKKSSFDRKDVSPLKASNRGNPKTIVCLDTGEEFNSISIAEQTLRSRGIKISGSHISSVCK